VVLTALLAVAAASAPAYPALARANEHVAVASSGPTRVHTWYYYGLNGINESVPAPLMARYADYAEDDGYTAAHVKAFKAAGGRYAVAYSDPSYVPYCYPPFAPPAGRCDGPIGSFARDESAWFHGRDGTRVRRYMDPHFQYQEALNPLAPAARRAWHDWTEALVQKAPWVDIFFADDSGGPLHRGDMSPRSSQFYDFNDAGVEITNDAVFRDAWPEYLVSAVRPLVINGTDPDTGLPSYGGAFLRPPRILGTVFEGCLRGGGHVKTDRHDDWRHELDGLLAHTALHKLAICFMMGTPTLENRLYTLASWWTTYDPQWSVAAPIDPVPGESALLPEFDIVPAYPIRTAAHVRDLRAESGAYVREFGGCYQNGRPIGACAAIVNPSGAAVSLPRLAQRYARTLALSGGDILHGGRAAWNAGVPDRVAAEAAVVVAR
jgi:hypothetical protein